MDIDVGRCWTPNSTVGAGFVGRSGMANRAVVASILLVIYPSIDAVK